MGCTSSSPLVTSGSTMLKEAAHVAADATKTAEDAVENVTQTLGNTIDKAKESVGSAVTGIAHELSNAIKDKTDETKNNLIEKMHLKNLLDHGNELNEPTNKMLNQNEHENVSGHDSNHKNGDNHHGSDDEDDNKREDDITQRLSRGSSPIPVQIDSDSLKTTTSDPEIEQALANRNENSPPTPKPNISELERLSAELHDLKSELVVTTSDAHVDESTQSTSDVVSAAEETKVKHTIDPRPHTTEWERNADRLAKDQKFHPNEIALRRRLMGPQLTAATAGTTIGTGTNMTTGGNGKAAVGPAETTVTSSLSRTQSKTSMNPPQYFRDFPLFKTDNNRLQGDDESGYSDRNNGSTSSPTPWSRYTAKMPRKRMTRNSTMTNVKKMHRQLASLVGYGSDRPTIPVSRTSLGGSRSSNILLGRNFDFNSNRIRVGSPPIMRRRFNQTLMPLQLNDSIRLTKRLGNRIGSPVKVVPLQKPDHSRLTATGPTKQIVSSSSTTSTSRIGLHSIGRKNSNSSKGGTRSQSPSSRSSTNNSIVLKSNCTTPTCSSPPKNSLCTIDMDVVVKNSVAPIISDHNQHTQCQLGTPSRSPSPLACGFVDDIRFGGNVGLRTPLGPGCTRSPITNRNTSSFLSSPRTSPFTVRKSYSDFEDKENKSIFVTDLSSVTENRHLLTPSPYKMRERCAVCYNKYTVK